MKILAVEFSSEQRSVAIAECAPGGAPVILGAASEKGGRSAHSIALVESALAQARLERETIDSIALGIGPGSYTGIRAAIALAQGWQLAKGVNTTGISSVECIAMQAQAARILGRINIIVDAQRNEFYIAGYDISETACVEAEKLHLAPLAEVQGRVGRGEVIIGPDAAVVGGRVVFPEANTVAMLACNRPGSVPAQGLEPIYLRETSFVKAPPPRII